MSRIARVVIAGYPHHIVQRGNNRDTVFFDEKDRLVYLYLLKKYAEKWKCPVIAYCLMPDHVHLLVKPSSDISLAKTMQGVTLCYTQYVNKKYHRRGRLWESRFYSCVVDREKYLWIVSRHIEQNPKRSGIVNKEEDYPYSSARAHVYETSDEVLGGKIFEEEWRTEYIAFLHSAVKEDETDKIRYCIRTGLPFGSEVFARAIGHTLGRDLEKKPRGRPRKKHSIL